MRGCSVGCCGVCSYGVWAVVCEVVVLAAVVWHCRAVGQNTSQPPPARTPASNLYNRLKCGLAFGFVRLIFEGIQSISVDQYQMLILIFQTPVQKLNVNLELINHVVENFT